MLLTNLKLQLCKSNLIFLVCQKLTMAHKGHAASKKRTLLAKKMRWKQKNDRCKQNRCAGNKKTIAANKKGALQTKNYRCKQKTIDANKKDALQTKNDPCKQKRCAANEKRCGYMNYTLVLLDRPHGRCGGGVATMSRVLRQAFCLLSLMFSSVH